MRLGSIWGVGKNRLATLFAAGVGFVLVRCQPMAALSLGLLLGLSFTFLAGEHPLDVLSILWDGVFASWYDFGMVVFYATPLLFCGLSVGVAYRCGLFNIGADGQLSMGALGAAAVGVLCPPLPYGLSVVLAALAAFLAGAFYGFVAGYLKARRECHEVITTIMLNYIAAGLCSWVVLYHLKNPHSQSPETALIHESFQLKPFLLFEDAPVTGALFLALFASVFFWWLFRHSVFGFKCKMVGQNLIAASYSGIRSDRVQMMAMSLAGGLAGLVAVNEVLGSSYLYRVGFSPGYGFTGIAVALMARSRPLAMIFTALLFGALHKGTMDLDFATETITSELSRVFQALVILCVASEGLYTHFRKGKG